MATFLKLNLRMQRHSCCPGRMRLLQCRTPEKRNGKPLLLVANSIHNPRRNFGRGSGFGSLTDKVVGSGAVHCRLHAELVRNRQTDEKFLIERNSGVPLFIDWCVLGGQAQKALSPRKFSQRNSSCLHTDFTRKWDRLPMQQTASPSRPKKSQRKLVLTVCAVILSIPIVIGMVLFWTYGTDNASLQSKYHLVDREREEFDPTGRDRYHAAPGFSGSLRHLYDFDDRSERIPSHARS